MTKLGQYIKERRKELGLTQAQLAKNIGFSRKTLALVENKPNRVLTRSGVVRLSIALDVDQSKLRLLNAQG